MVNLRATNQHVNYQHCESEHLAQSTAQPHGAAVAEF